MFPLETLVFTTAYNSFYAFYAKELDDRKLKEFYKG